MRWLLLLLVLLMSLPKPGSAQATKQDTLELAVEQAQSPCEHATAVVALAAWFQRNQQKPRGIALYREIFHNEELCDRPRCDAAQDLGYLYVGTQQFDSALWYAERSVPLAEAINDTGELAYAWEKVALAHHFMNHYQEAIPAYQNAINSYRHVKRWSKLAGMYTNLSLIYTSIAWNDKALEAALKALEVHSEKNTNPEWIAEASNGVAWVLLQTKDFEESLNFSKRALKWYSNANHEWGLLNSYTLLGNTHMELHQPDSALPYYQKKYELLLNGKDPIGLAKTLLSLAEVAKQQQAHQTADSTIRTAIALLQAQQAPVELALAQMQLGELLLMQNNAAQALQVLQQALPVLEAEGNVPGLQRTSSALAQAHIQLQNPERAQHFHAQALALKDSIFETNRLQSVANMRVRYNTQQKEQELLFQQQQVAEQKAINAQQTRIIWLTVVGLILLLALVLAIATGYRSKQRSNQQLGQQKAALEKSDQEKALLLKEIHHRVKNNLQVISSLLYLQSRSISDPAALSAVQEGQNRVQSIGLIHQKLYQTDHLGEVAANEYLPQLLSHLQSTFSTTPVDLQLSIEPENLALDIDTAVPFALIVNELVTNAFKYGLNTSNPSLSLTLRSQTDKSLQLVVRDNGPGLPDDFNPRKTKSLGMRLVRELCKQLRGEAIFSSDNGTVVTVNFRDTELRKQVD